MIVLSLASSVGRYLPARVRKLAALTSIVLRHERRQSAARCPPKRYFQKRRLNEESRVAIWRLIIRDRYIAPWSMRFNKSKSDYGYQPQSTPCTPLLTYHEYMDSPMLAGCPLTQISVSFLFMLQWCVHHRWLQFCGKIISTWLHSLLADVPFFLFSSAFLRSSCIIKDHLFSDFPKIYRSDSFHLIIFESSRSDA